MIRRVWGGEEVRLIILWGAWDQHLGADEVLFRFFNRGAKLVPVKLRPRKNSLGILVIYCFKQKRLQRMLDIQDAIRSNDWRTVIIEFLCSNIQLKSLCMNTQILNGSILLLYMSGSATIHCKIWNDIASLSNDYEPKIEYTLAFQNLSSCLSMLIWNPSPYPEYCCQNGRRDWKRHFLCRRLQRYATCLILGIFVCIFNMHWYPYLMISDEIPTV